MKRQKVNNELGMTLVELLAAITILAIIVGPMFLLIGHAYNNYIEDQRKVKALTIAQQKMEEAKTNQNWLMTYDKAGYVLAQGPAYLADDQNYYIVDNNTIDGSYQYLILMKTSDTDVDFVKIKVEVFWKEVKPERQISFIISEARRPKP
ncbi:type IV pilus modification PilV family protein [Tepidibacillus sp. LV47]|uniref:type IV pilus modification PilV family protein n=1 Tax=Tepidibacillus sp. LV47 TaxID=3398228 RepID=UPI003AAA7C08